MFIILWAGGVQHRSAVLYLFAKWTRVDVTLPLSLRRALLAFSRMVLTGFLVHYISVNSGARFFIYAPNSTDHVALYCLYVKIEVR